jgi:hypothetical protein
MQTSGQRWQQTLCAASSSRRPPTCSSEWPVAAGRGGGLHFVHSQARFVCQDLECDRGHIHPSSLYLLEHHHVFLVQPEREQPDAATIKAWCGLGNFVLLVCVVVSVLF